MKNRMSSVILALGITAAPVFAKSINRRADNKKFSQSELNEKRSGKAYKRFKEKELEKEIIKEVEEEINMALTVVSENPQRPEIKARLEEPEIFLADDVPVNGIDLSDVLDKLELTETT